MDVDRVGNKTLLKSSVDGRMDGVCIGDQKEMGSYGHHLTMIADFEFHSIVLTEARSHAEFAS